MTQRTEEVYWLHRAHQDALGPMTVIVWIVGITLGWLAAVCLWALL